MPTSSTAKIVASKGPSSHGGGPSGHYARHRRPKSCKYDTYRLRSRYSQVEENLFGEPLKNKLMARSRSMEAISQEEALSGPTAMPTQPQASDQALFTRRQPEHRPKHRCPRDDIRRQERPRTALATMRTSNNSNPEFEKRSSGQGGEPGIVRVITGDQVRSLIVPFNNTKAQPLILSRREFEKIKQAAKLISNLDKDTVRKEREEAREAALKAAAERKVEFETLASFHNTPEETEMEKENRLRDHHLIERAHDLKMERSEEVKKLNQHIIQVKCHAIRDMQLEDKEKRLNEMAEADRHLEEQIEKERKQAEEMEAARAHRTVDFCKEFRLGLDQQKAELEAQKLVEKERFETELALRRSHEASLREQEIKDAEVKRQKMVELQSQMMIDMEETRKRKEIEAELAKKNDERILALQDARRHAEVRREEDAKKQKREWERDMMRMKAAVEKEQELKLRREELRLIRQQEAEDRKWRQKNLEMARVEAQRSSELRRVRAEQMRQREEIAAKSIERDRQHWEEVQKMWQTSVELDREQQEKRAKAQREYLAALQGQMAERANVRATLQQNLKEDSKNVETERELQKNRIQHIKEKKLQQLKAYNIPDKYLKDIERKVQNAQNSRFTYSYFGLK